MDRRSEQPLGQSRCHSHADLIRDDLTRRRRSEIGRGRPSDPLNAAALLTKSWLSWLVMHFRSGELYKSDCPIIILLC